jgi:hypothetical protein
MWKVKYDSLTAEEQLAWVEEMFAKRMQVKEDTKRYLEETEESHKQLDARLEKAIHYTHEIDGKIEDMKDCKSRSNV